MLRQYFGVAFETLRDQGELVSELDSADLASAFVALIDGLQIQWLYDKRSINIERILRSFLQTIIPRFAHLVDETEFGL